MSEQKIQNYLSLKLDQWQSYHSHKENMSNAGFLLQLSLFGAIVSEGLWPPDWVENVTSLPRAATFLVYFLLWFLIHYYMRWQLINKRIGALYFAGIDRALRKLSTTSYEALDHDITNLKTHEPNKWKSFLSKVLYVPNGFNRMDASVEGLPNFVAIEVRGAFSRGSGAETLEALMTYASLVLMLIVALKIFFGS